MVENQSILPSHLKSAVLSSSIQFAGVAGRFRNQIIGTITLTAGLVAVFQAEVVFVELLGHSSSKAMLNSLPRGSKIFLTAVAGPFLHNGPTHLTGNLGVLLVTGAYLEYEYDRNTVYLFYPSVGYLAAWAPLTLGSVGAIGASGVTYGLTSWMLLHSMSRLLEMVYDATFDMRVFHIAPFFFSFIKIQQPVVILGGLDAGDITHIFGVYIGIILGLYLVIESHDINFRDLVSVN